MAQAGGHHMRLEEWDHLRIAIREKPLSDSERSKVQVMLKVDGNRLIAYYPESKEGLLYNYDYFFPEDSTQMDLFQTIGMELVDLIMNGYSACCLAYGPAATGKTHTLFGSDQEPGLIQLATKELLHAIETAPAHLQFRIKMCYWEMSNREIRDALSIENTENLPVRKNKEMGGVYIPGLTEVDITSWGELDDYIMHGNINRIKMSEQRGARWHGFVKLKITMEDTNRPNHLIYTTLTFGHLKGPDRVGQKGADGDVLRHGSSINQSISVLGSAMLHAVELRRRKAMGEAAGGDATQSKANDEDLTESLFSQSKLTQVLTGPLCGSVATVMLSTVSTLDYHETTDTLENLQNAQQIATNLKRSVHTTEAGKVWKQLQKAEANLPQTNLALGHPLSEIEETVRKLQDAYAGLLKGKVYEEAVQSVGRDIPSLPKATECAARHHQKWKQSVLDSKIHGKRSKIYIPTKGAHAPKDTNTYVGQWCGGLKEGFGEQLTKLTRYEGEWKAGLREGKGTLWRRPTEKAEWIRVYKGEWKDDRRHGRGVFWYENGDVYEGYFEDGARAAVGKIFLASGDKIEGQWKANLVEGWATHYLDNGDRFEGHWMKGMKEGPGAFFYHAKNQIYRGEWSKNIAKFGSIEDLPAKASTENSRFLPRVELLNPDAVLEKEKQKVPPRQHWVVFCVTLCPSPPPPLPKILARAIGHAAQHTRIITPPLLYHYAQLQARRRIEQGGTNPAYSPMADNDIGNSGMTDEEIFGDQRSENGALQDDYYAAEGITAGNAQW